MAELEKVGGTYVFIFHSQPETEPVCWELWRHFHSTVFDCRNLGLSKIRLSKIR